MTGVQTCALPIFTSPDAQNFLFDNIKGFLFSESLPVTEQAEIDTTKEGTVKW